MSSDKLSVFNSRARIDLEHDPVKIRLHPTYTKTGKKRITFMSPEAKDALIEWLTFRQQYLDQAEGRSATYERKQEYNVIFPFTSANYNAMWRNALTKANLLKRDSQTNRMTMRPHNLRKFFRLRVAKNGRDEAEALMGHQKGLNAVYARFEGEYGDQRLEEAYVKSIPELSIYKRSVELSKLQQEIVQKNQTLQDELQQMNAQRSEQQIIIINYQSKT